MQSRLLPLPLLAHVWQAAVNVMYVPILYSAWLLFMSFYLLLLVLASTAAAAALSFSSLNS